MLNSRRKPCQYPSSRWILPNFSSARSWTASASPDRILKTIRNAVLDGFSAENTDLDKEQALWAPVQRSERVRMDLEPVWEISEATGQHQLAIHTSWRSRGKDGRTESRLQWTRFEQHVPDADLSGLKPKLSPHRDYGME